MNFTAEQLKGNFDKLISYIDMHFQGERKEQLIQLYTDHEERLLLMPASGNINYHNCFPGGYVDHVIRVIDMAIAVNEMWESYGANMNHTVEELVFAGLNHDLGKIGTDTEDNYLPCEEQWMLKKGQLYVMNPRIQYMKTAERSLMILQSEGIQMSEKEYLAIKLHDGLYEEANKSYYISYSEDYALKTMLPYIIHQADLIATKTEEKR
jgi:hypothetical protein